MLRTLRNIVISVFLTGAIGAAVKFLYIDRLTPEQRAMWQGRVDDAVSSGKQAATERRAELERRLNELVGPTHNNN